MLTVNLSPELVETLQKLAAANQLSVDELVENLLTDYAKAYLNAGEMEPPTDEEIAAVKKTIAEAEKPDAVWYTQEEVEARIFEKIDNYDARQPKAG